MMDMDRLRRLLPRLTRCRDGIAKRCEELRQRPAVVALTLLAVVMAPFFWWGILAARGIPASLLSRAAVPVEVRTPKAPEETPREVLRQITAAVRPGCSVYSLLVQAGMPSGEVLRLIKDFAVKADLTKCRPGEIFTIRQHPDGAVASISYQKSPLEVYRADRQTGSWLVSRESVPFTTRIERITGTVSSSLFEAMAAAGEKDALTISLIGILAWEIDFAHESQPGDRFSLLVEKFELHGRPVGYGPILAATYSSSDRVIQSYSFKNPARGMDYFNESGLSTRKSFLKSPLRFSRITSGYTSRRLHPVTGVLRSHYAIDYAAPTGTPVWSVADGTVRTMGWDAGSGRKVSVSHPGGYESWYLHLSGYARGLRVGKRVRQEQVIGYVGATGLATGPHLDYRLTRNGAWVNPLKEDFPRGEPVPATSLAEFQGRREWLASLLETAVPPVTASASVRR